MCTGTNIVGSTNMSAYLTVEFPPQMDQNNLKFWSWDQRPVTLFCKGNFIQDKTPMNQCYRKFPHFLFICFLKDFSQGITLGPLKFFTETFLF